jgi:hypothetical protein
VGSDSTPMAEDAKNVAQGPQQKMGKCKDFYETEEVAELRRRVMLSY